MRRLTPNAIKGITPHVITLPVGVDIVAKILQSALSNVVSKSFARSVYRSGTIDEREYTFPSVFVGNGKDYFDLLDQDNFDSYSFVRVNDPITFEEDTRTLAKKRWALDVDVIVWFNLNRFDTSKSGDYTPEIIDSAIAEINKSGLSAVEVNQIYTEPSQVFNGYTLNIEQTQRLYYPYSCFRINLEVVHPDSC